jgi:hypothetical protein
MVHLLIVVCLLGDAANALGKAGRAIQKQLAVGVSS